MPRFTQPPIHLDYRKFAVVYDARDIISGKVDVLKELTDMPSKQPMRFRSLRAELQKASRLMAYSFKDCGLPRCDAFSAFTDYISSLSPPGH